MRQTWKPAVVLAAVAIFQHPIDAQSGAANGLTTVPGIKVGHHTLAQRPTGCTVILTEAGDCLILMGVMMEAR